MFVSSIPPGPIDEEIEKIFTDVPTVTLFSNVVHPSKKLWPRGLMATFAPDQPFFRDPFVDSNYGFGCSIFRIDLICEQAYPSMERIETFKKALAAIDEFDLNIGGRVGLFHHRTPNQEIQNFVCVFAGLSAAKTNEFETRIGKAHQEVSELRQTQSSMHPTSTMAKTINDAKISMKARTFYFDEFASEASANRKRIATKFAETLGAKILGREHEVAWNVLVDDRVLTWYSDCAAYRTFVPDSSNEYVPYASPLEVSVFARTIGRTDPTQQAIPCVWRLGAIEKDARVLGPSNRFAPIEMKPFEGYDLHETKKFHAIVVRCAERPYDFVPTNEFEREIGRV